MASRGKKKTTMAKLSRESRLRERRVEKAARKEARRQAAVMDPQASVIDPQASVIDPSDDERLGDEQGSPQTEG